ncbi:IclR family transcriptional regulator [Amycolatopsis jejuensis]|uniref:IclR family transcriptional regulator n=1 Tax=Amycolatopsis jejuensis TaxID=330084 RepID=UPI000526CCF2|nr:helix-turn-helix domain-containing protein [Amycolatopsis jejuensis]
MPTHPTPDGRPRPHHRMIDRVSTILDLAARSRHGVTLTEFARELDAPMSSIQGLVNGLVATGYLDEHDRRYTLGPAPFLLIRLAGRPTVTTVTHEDLEALHTETGMTAVLAIVVGSDLYYVDYSSHDPRYAYLAEGFVRRSPIRTSTGWVLLAGMENRDLWARIGALPPADADLVERFLKDLTQIQAEGVVAAPNASTEADGVSVAVVEDGRTVAAVGIMGSHAEVAERKAELIEVLTRHREKWRAPRPS